MGLGLTVIAGDFEQGFDEAILSSSRCRLRAGTGDVLWTWTSTPEYQTAVDAITAYRRRPRTPIVDYCQLESQASVRLHCDYIAVF